MSSAPEDRPLYITVSAIDCYVGQESFFPGMILRLRKDPNNRFDDETIDVFGPKGVKYGHVANSVYTVCRGTHSAGYVYHAFGNEAECRVMFICEDFAIAEVMMEEEAEAAILEESAA